MKWYTVNMAICYVIISYSSILTKVWFDRLNISDVLLSLALMSYHKYIWTHLKQTISSADCTFCPFLMSMNKPLGRTPKQTHYAVLGNAYPVLFNYICKYRWEARKAEYVACKTSARSSAFKVTVRLPIVLQISLTL